MISPRIASSPESHLLIVSVWGTKFPHSNPGPHSPLLPEGVSYCHQQGSWLGNRLWATSGRNWTLVRNSRELDFPVWSPLECHLGHQDRLLYHCIALFTCPMLRTKSLIFYSSSPRWTNELLTVRHNYGRAATYEHTEFCFPQISVRKANYSIKSKWFRILLPTGKCVIEPGACLLWASERSLQGRGLKAEPP